MIKNKSSQQEANVATWYQQTVTKIYRFTYALLQNREEAEDITQETYFRCLKKDSDELPPYPYLKQVARNLIYDRYRHLKTAPDNITQDYIDNQPSLDKSVSEDNWVDKALIEQLMKQLPAQYRQVLELRIVQGFSRKETAKHMGKSEDVVRGLQYRALQALRNLIQNH